MTSDSLIFKTERPWPNKRLRKGAIVGHTTTSTCRIWLRTGALGKFCLLVYPQTPGASNVVFEVFKSVPFKLSKLPSSVQKHAFSVPDYSRDTTHVVDIRDLVPGTCYGYALWGHDAGGGKATQRILLGHDRLLTFRTLPDGDEPFDFAFFSCHMPYEKTLFGRTRIVNMDTWEAMHQALSRHCERGLRFVLATGDQVYADVVRPNYIWPSDGEGVIQCVPVDISPHCTGYASRNCEPPQHR